MHPINISRRTLFRSALAAGGAMLLAERAWADPYGAALQALDPRVGTPVRIRGLVTIGGRPVARVAVSDGRDLVVTDRNGRYTLHSSSDRSWLSLCLPRGAKIPVSAKGTSALHRPILPDARGEMVANFGLEKAGSDDSDHAFLLLADPQTQNAFELERMHAETVPDVVKTVKGLTAGQSFAVVCGDIMFDDLTLYPEYERAAGRMGLPCFQVVGNHDLDYGSRVTEDSTRTFESHFGPSHYSFNLGAVHYVVLNDVLWFGTAYLGYLTAEQLAWLAADLALVETGSLVVVCLHIPLASTQADRTGASGGGYGNMVNNREALYSLLAPFKAHVLAGHTHENEHIIGNGVHEHVLGTTCGAWWSGDICFDGTPNGYGVFEVKGEELRWRYQATGMPATHQMRAYPRGADPQAPDEIVVNLWDWSPGWTVTWFQDGERRGAMARRTGLDPRAVKEQTGPGLPPRRGWVEPMPTAHLFYAAAPTDTRRVTIEARDPFGRVYTEQLILALG